MLPTLYCEFEKKIRRLALQRVRDYPRHSQSAFLNTVLTECRRSCYLAEGDGKVIERPEDFFLDIINRELIKLSQSEPQAYVNQQSWIKSQAERMVWRDFDIDMPEFVSYVLTKCWIAARICEIKKKPISKNAEKAYFQPIINSSRADFRKKLSEERTRSRIFASYSNDMEIINAIEDPNAGNNPELNVMSAEAEDEAFKLIVSCLGHSPQMLEVFRLRHYDDLSYNEIATIKQISYDSSRQFFSRAVKILRRAF